MELPARRKRFAPRSRAGCLECREHHQKCDEDHPVCGLCHKLHRNCRYQLRLSWSRRQFSKSTYGQSTTHHIATPAIQGSSRGKAHAKGDYRAAVPLVYAVPGSGQSPPIPSTVQTGDLLSLTRSLTNGYEQELLSSVPRAMSLIPGLSISSRRLLEYFTVAADSFSCNNKIKKDFCATFIPIAVQESRCMASALSLAAVHRFHAGLSHDQAELAMLQLHALKQQRMGLLGSSSEALIASTLLLCYSGVIAGAESGLPWRAHLEGAACLLRQNPSGWTTHTSQPIKAFISRCFVSLAALANVSGNPPSPAVSMQALRMIELTRTTPPIDEFTAYSFDFAYILFELGDFLREKAHTSSQSSIVNAVCLEERCTVLVRRLRAMIRTWNSCVQDITTQWLTPDHIHEYRCVNESYYQAALLHVHQRIAGLRPSTKEVQDIVSRILGLLHQVKLHRGPCLGVVLFFPAFSAGCGAVHAADREQVRAILTSMVDMIGFVNVRQGMAILEDLWSHRDRNGESEMNCSWNQFIAKDVDILLY
ncbi:fungal-specific transcription factor domain-containing protein [Xylaria digitata]|nr:fungal-specific transcription factor domain-containing protein [Xylaria digitata]